MAHPKHTSGFALLEEAVTVLFCRIDDTYVLHLNPRAEHYASLKQLSDSEVLTLALFQQLRGVESERSFLGEAVRFFSHLFPGVSSAFIPSRCTVVSASSGALWSTCGGPSCLSSGGRARDPDRRRFDSAVGPAPAPSRAVGGV